MADKTVLDRFGDNSEAVLLQLSAQVGTAVRLLADKDAAEAFLEAERIAPGLVERERIRNRV